MHNPLVSIIMPAYNAARTIKESINSVMAQTYTHWELIVINDASTDHTADIVQKFQYNYKKYASDEQNKLVPHEFIHLITNEQNAGIAASRNKGIHAAQGAYIAFLDSDDLWHPEKLERQLNAVLNHGVSTKSEHMTDKIQSEVASTAAELFDPLISYTATKYIDESGVPSTYILHAKPKLTYHDLLKANRMSCSSILVSRALMLSNLFPEGFLHEDYVVWLNILKNAVPYAIGVDEPLLTYRLSATSTSGNRIKSAKMIYNAYKLSGQRYCMPLYCTLRYTVHSISKRYFIKKSGAHQKK